MSSVPPGLSPLRLPLGDIVYYPTGRPSIRVLAREIAALGYEVSVFLSLTLTSGPSLWESGIILWSLVRSSSLLLRPRHRRCYRIRRPWTLAPTRATTTKTTRTTLIQIIRQRRPLTRAATRATTTSPTRTALIQTFPRMATGALSAPSCGLFPHEEHE